MTDLTKDAYATVCTMRITRMSAYAYRRLRYAYAGVKLGDFSAQCVLIVVKFQFAYVSINFRGRSRRNET